MSRVLSLLVLFCMIFVGCHSAVTLYRVNCGSKTAFTDSFGHTWAADQYFNTDVQSVEMTSTVTSFAKTKNPTFYATGRELTDKRQKTLTYTFNDLEDGKYVCSLMFVESWVKAANKRVFDIYINNALRYVGMDVYDEAGANTAHSKRFICTAKGGVISVGLTRVNGNPRVSAIEIRKIPDEPCSNCGNLSCCNKLCYDATAFQCFGNVLCSIGMLNCGASCYNPDTQTCDDGVIIDNPIPSPSPSPLPDPGEAHANAGDDQTVMDSNGNGSEQVTLDGSRSIASTGGTITKFEWSVNGNVVATGETTQANINVGTSTVTLTVTDSNGKSATDTVDVTVLASGQPASGVDGYYYTWRGQKIGSSFNRGPWEPFYAQLENDFDALDQTNFKGTRLNVNFAAWYKGYIRVPASGNYFFAIESDEGSFFQFNNGQLVIDNSGFHGMQKIQGFAAGLVKDTLYPFEIQYYNSVAQAGLKMYWTVPGAQETIIPASAYFHYIVEKMPVAMSLSDKQGPTAGGNTVTINGYGFVYPAAQTTVRVSDTVVTDFTILDATTIRLKMPPRQKGLAYVRVTTPVATSIGLQYEYTDANIIPVEFTTTNQFLYQGIGGPTCLAFGPDEKLYVGTTEGSIWRFTLDDNSNLIEQFRSNVLQGTQILGIAFHPKDTDPNDIKVYVSFNVLYQAYQGLGSDMKAGVSIISGANLDQRNDIVTGLDDSERDHGVNGLGFNQEGKLMILAGSNTNGGIPGPLQITSTHPEKIYTAAMLIADIDKPNFDGRIAFANNDNFNGPQTAGNDVRIYATGIKNGFSMLFHTNGLLYVIDNGPTAGLGKISTGCNTDGVEPASIDKLNIVEEGRYYGHPNRARGTKDDRQCRFRWFYEPNDGYFTPPISMIASSMNGIVEYTANTFGGKMRGQMIVSRLNGELWHLAISDDGRTVYNQYVISPFGGLNMVMNSDGSLISADYYNNFLTVVKPVEAERTDLYVVSVFPTRGVIAGGSQLTIRGYQFANGATVTLGGKPCPVTSTAAKKLKCTIPSGAAGQLADLVVTSNGQSYTLNRAYRYMNI